jgi:hypothetical protein
MQNLMSSMFQVKSAQPSGPNVTAAFANAGLLGHMFSNTTMQATAQMEGAMQHIRNTTLTSKLGGHAEGVSAIPSGASAASEMSGLHVLSPAANFSTSFANYLRAQQENPEMM